MHVQALKSDDIEAFISENEIVFIDFWASWCSPCKQFSIAYEKASQQFPSISFGKVNIEEQQQVAHNYRIQSIPHLLIFKSQLIVYSDAGSISYNALQELAQQSLLADVSEIHAQLYGG